MAYSNNATQGYPNKMFDYFSFGLPVMSSLKNKETINLIKNNKTPPLFFGQKLLIVQK